MGIEKEKAERLENEAIEKLLELGAIEKCPMDGSQYHNTGAFTEESLKELGLYDDLHEKMVCILNDTPDEEDCSFCHSKEELEDE